MEHLTWHLNQSEPGAELHHLSVLTTSADPGPLGVAGDVESWMFVIAASGGPEAAMKAVAQTVVGATAEVRAKGLKTVFAVVSQEVWLVDAENFDDLSRRLMAEGKLNTHPKAVEATFVYGACADGRRWRGFRYLTGPRAGQTRDVRLLVGAVSDSEAGPVVAAPMVRRMVGLKR